MLKNLTPCPQPKNNSIMLVSHAGIEMKARYDSKLGRYGMLHLQNGHVEFYEFCDLGFSSVKLIAHL